MTTISENFSAKTAITISLASLASSATFVAGQESNQIDNSSDKFVDAHLEGFITVGTSPTTTTQIQVHVWGSNESLATTAKDVLDGTDSAETLSSVGVGRGFLKHAVTLDVDSTTSDRRYDFGNISVASLFGGVMPKYWGVFVTHNTVAALNATAGNHALNYIGVKYDAA